MIDIMFFTDRGDTFVERDTYESVEEAADWLDAYKRQGYTWVYFPGGNAAARIDTIALISEAPKEEV